jgi:ribosomal protein S18 acetylase RimI-like enzyme
MVIRDVLPDEYATVGELVVDVYRSIIPGLDGYAGELRDVAGRIGAGVLVWVAEVDGALAGTVSYVPGPGPYAEFENPLGAGIRMLAVLPEFQGRGIGEALVRACIERARADGRERVYLDTTEWMETAQRLYRRIGFKRAPELDWEPAPSVTLTAYVYELATSLGF